MSRFEVKDISGEKFNFLTVIKQVPKPPHLKNNHTYWLCRCDCGNEKIIDQRALKSGNTKSCGCYGKLSSKNNILKYNMKKQKLRNTFVKEDNFFKFYTKKNQEFIVDEDDFDKVYQHYWILRGGYICSKFSADKKQKYTLLHRYLMRSNIPDDLQVDHINRNRFDNRKQNLRVVTREENTHNRSTIAKSKCGGFNVYYRHTKNKYEASFTFNKTHYWVGTFDDVKTAEVAVLKKRKEIGGLLYEQRNYN